MKYFMRSKAVTNVIITCSEILKIYEILFLKKYLFCQKHFIIFTTLT